MTASAGAWYRVGTVNVTNSQQAIVGVGTNWQNDVTAIAIGDIFTLDAKTWYEVTAVNSDTSITLDRDFEGSTESGASYAIVRNTSGTILTRIAGQVSVQFNQKQLFLDELRTWLNSDNATEELTDSHGLKRAVKTPSQMVSDAEQAASTARSEWNAARDAVETRAQKAYRESLEAASGGKNTVFYDAQGNANVMVWINAFNCEDINSAILQRTGEDLQLGTGVHPAFIRNGIQLRGFWCAKYQASPGIGGGCCVIPGVQPLDYIIYDQAKSLCVNKGASWHLMSNAEWAAVSFMSLAYGNHVRGNTNYGRAHDAKHEVARRYDSLSPGDSASGGRADCGTGPSTWSHDGTQFGVFDLVGNVWEWVDQLKLLDGQVFSPLDNNPDLDESAWPSHNCYLDSFGSTGSSVVLNSLIENRLGTLGDSESVGDYNRNKWASTKKSETYIASDLMRKLAIESANAEANLSGWIYSRNYGERIAFRGAHWTYGSEAGLGALRLNSSRLFKSSILGFRPSKFEA